MSFLFGRLSEEKGAVTAETARGILEEARLEKSAFVETPVESILDVLDRVGLSWRAGEHWYGEAVRVLPEETGFSPEMIRKSLEILSRLCSREHMQARIRAELGTLEILDRSVSKRGFEGKLRFFPHGVLLHVSA